MMRLMKNGLAALALAIVLAGCVQFKTTSLYDGTEPAPKPTKPDKISLAVEPIIFQDDASNFWVSDNPDCTTGGVTTKVVHSGKNALEINWNRDPAICEWAGFGIGWDGWAGKDLTDVYDYAAIQFYIRTKTGKMFGLPIVLTLEDYSGKMAWSYTGNKYFERYSIDEEWQKVVVPLNTFDLEEDGLDIGNVKQLQFELQQAGNIYLDDVELVFYEPQPVEPWLEVAPRPDPLAFPITLFGDDFVNDHGWGLLTDNCQTIELTKATASEGLRSIHAKWDKSIEDCYLVALGASWNKWYPVDLSSVSATTMIELDIRTPGGAVQALPVKVGFEDYERNLLLAPLQPSLVDGGSYDETWRRVRIPLTALQGSGNLANIKQFIIQMESDGEIYLDNIRLVRNSG